MRKFLLGGLQKMHEWQEEFRRKSPFLISTACNASINFCQLVATFHLFIFFTPNFIRDQVGKNTQFLSWATDCPILRECSKGT